VARSGQAVIITRRGKPLVRILPAADEPSSIMERREAYLKKYGRIEDVDEVDFDTARRTDVGKFTLDEEP
jgi:prevent-host-death family protein